MHAFVLRQMMALGALFAALIPAAAAQEHGTGRLAIEPYVFTTDGGDSVAAELGRLAVPERYNDPRGATIEIAFVRFPATTPQPGTPIVYLAGGPGGSGIEAARGPRFPLFQALRKLGDVVALDQRGVGMSRPVLDCPEPILTDPAMVRTPTSTIAPIRNAVAACAAHWRDQGVDLTAYNTESSADDLDALRQALEAEKLRLVGMSYGTTLGLTAIRRHGETIEAAVLAGVEGPDHALKLPVDVDRQLEAVSAMLATDPIVGTRLPNFAKLVAELAARLDANPISVPLPARSAESPEPTVVTITGFDVRWAVANLVGHRETITLLPELFVPAAQDDFVPLAHLLLHEFSNMRLSAMGLAMDCASGASEGRREEIESQAASSIVGHTIDFPFPVVCDAIGVPELGASFRAPLRADTRVLFLSGSLDGRTPPSNAEEILPGFRNGTHILVENVGHDDELLVGSPEILAAITGFLAGDPPGVDTLTVAPVSLVPPASGVLTRLLLGRPAAERTLAIENVIVIDGTGAAPRAGTTVIIKNGRIKKLGPAGELDVPSDAQRIDGTGKYLIPGLWDSHVHLSKVGPTALPLFVAYGVTGVRDMGSDFAEVSAWRAEINAGLRIGPRIVTPGPMIEAASNVARMKAEGVVEPVDRVRAAVASAEDAPAVVDSLAALGVDFVKVRSFESPEALMAIAGAAAGHRLPFTGHAFGLTPEQIVALGYRSVEHFLFPTLDDLEPAARAKAFGLLAGADIVVVPTMVNWHESLSLPAEVVAEVAAGRGDPGDPRIRYISEHLRADWLEQAAERAEPSQLDLEAIVESTGRNLREMRAAGVKVLPGTDAAVVLIVPGHSLHDELRHLVEALWMTPHEAIVAATSEATAVLGLSNDVGTIEPGKRADLVLLGANPLDDISNTRAIVDVVHDGRHYDREGLNAILDGVAKSVAP
jgi:imidazolonepropionase-like amidohydrolase/pimeloyl-ACP methyl ester carboxylesterase